LILAEIEQKAPATALDGEETFLSALPPDSAAIAIATGDSAEAVSKAGAGRRTARIQQVVIEIPHGAGPVRKAWLRPGQSLTIGRTDDADFIVPGDEYLSGSHFELTCDFTACRLR
jgi:hypothetical protein